jgi:hypothetical protein
MAFLTPAKEADMSKIVSVGARKLPAMLGMGILAVAAVGIGASLFGASLPIAIEIIAAGAGIAAGSRVA